MAEAARRTGASGCRQAGHSPAGIGAAPADLDALRHGAVVRIHLLARIRARRAYFRAHAANARMIRRDPQHVIGGGPANLHAIGQHAKVVRLHVFASQGGAMGDGFDRDAPALQALLDTMPEIVGHEALVGHLFPSMPIPPRPPPHGARRPGVIGKERTNAASLCDPTTGRTGATMFKPGIGRMEVRRTAWWARGDSNARPLPCQGSALTN